MLHQLTNLASTLATTSSGDSSHTHKIHLNLEIPTTIVIDTPARAIATQTGTKATASPTDITATLMNTTATSIDTTVEITNTAAITVQTGKPEYYTHLC